MRSRRLAAVEDERGTAVFEFLLALPVLVLVMVGFISLGWTLVLRHHALVAARNAAFYERLADRAASEDELSGWVSPNGERWTSDVQRTSILAELAEPLEKIAGMGEAAEFFETVLGDYVAEGAIEAKVGHQPQGYAARSLRLGEVPAHYDLPAGTWTSDDSGTFFDLLKKKIGFNGLGF